MRHVFPRFVVLVGLGSPRRIDNVMTALAFLEDYPRMLKDEAFQATRSACLDALAGTTSTEEAYDVFCAFARRRRILIDDPVQEFAYANRRDLAA